MKKKSIYALMSVGLLFTACKSDDLHSAPDEVSSKGDRTLYVNVSIRGDIDGSGTRTASTDGSPSLDDFDPGESESNVKSAWFVFYDNTGKQVGNVVESTITSETTWSTEDATNSVEKYYKSTVGVTLKNGENSPANVICYLNPSSIDDFTKSLQEIQTVTRSTLFTTETKTTGTGDAATTVSTNYFPMSNSVYYANTGSLAPEIATPVESNQLHATKKAADEDTNPVQIYVERYAAKLKFQSGEVKEYDAETKSVADDATATDVKLTFVPKRWILNAACTKTYIVKSYRKESTDGSDILADNYSYQELNQVINPSGASVWKWNNNTYHRSYWGMSPAYFTSKYPEVSSDVNALSGDLNQKYYSYSELTGTNPAGYAVVNGTEQIATTTYVCETTVGSKALKTTNPAAAIPSVIIVGDYEVKVGNNSAVTGKNFYTYLTGSESNKTRIYFDADNEGEGKSIVAGGESMLRRFIYRASNILYKKVGEEYKSYSVNNTEDLKKLVPLFTIAVPTTEVIGDIKLAERFRTLQFDEDYIDPEDLNNLYIGTSKGYMQVVIPGDETTVGPDQISVTDANKELVNTVGYCEFYNAGAAYFNIPVRHLGWYRSNHTVDEAASNAIDWSRVNVGDYGIVRNHSYDIKVNKIEGLGTGIGGKDNPIVPPIDEKTYYVAYQINILKWAVLQQQSINL